MGDGGVVFMPSQHVMERLPISTSDCRGSNGGGFSLKKKSMQFKESQQQQRKHEKNMSVEKEEFEVEKDEVEEGELHLGVENGEFIPEKREVEKGEFFVPDRWRREVEKGEFIPDKRRKGEVEKEEFGLRRGWKNEVEKGEFVPDRWRKKEADKLEFSAGRGRKGELEKGEITPDKWRKRDENGEYAKEKAWASARDRDHTSPSTKFTESGSESRRRSSIWEPGYSRDSKNSLRSAEDELGSAKYETGHRKDYSSGGWLKKHVNESGNSAYRYHADYTDHPSSKTRRLSGDVNVEKYRSHSPMERSSRNYSSSNASSVNRYSSRHDPSLSSRRTHDRHAGYFDQAPHDRARFHDHRDRSPSHFDRSPHDQARYHDHRNRSPARQRSPHPRARQYDRRDRTPGYMDKSTGDYEHSPVARSRYQERRDRTPGYLERSPDRDQSPHVRTRHHDHRDHTPGHLDRSPLDCDRSPLLQARRHDHRDRTPSYLDRSPRERGRPQDHYEASRKSEGSEAKHSQNGSQGHEEKLGHMSSVGKDTFRNSSSGQSHDNEKLDKSCESVENSTNDQSYEEEQLQNVSLNCTEPTKVDGAPDELLSMEEDMDISPPHAPVAAESTLGTWFYLDHFGVERGPSRLCDLKRLVEEGVLQSDHLIKHSGSDWWLTVENAASPLVEVNFPSIVSDTVTQLVSPPEAPGNLLVDNGDIGQSANQPDLEQFVALPQLPTPVDDSSEGPGNSEDFRIDDRVTALLEGYSVIEGRELETLGEALNMMFEHKNLETWGNSEGLPRSQPSPREQCHRRHEESSKSYESTSKELAHYKDYSFQWGYTSDWFSGRWSCKGGDWKRHDESVEERSSKRKLVLNDGYPLCQMSKSGYEDPRWRRKDELYYPSRVRKLNLPPWAFSLSEERADCNGTSRSNQIKQPLGLRGVKGTILPVVRINTCVVNDRVPPVTESCLTVRAYERHSSRSVRPPSSSDGRSTLADDVSQSRSDGKDLEGLQKCIEPIIISKDHVCSANELQLHLGDWYYLDGAGHEHGPSTFRELHVLVENGTIQKHTSVFRKFDNIWVPVSYADMSSKVEVYSEDQKVAPVADSRAAPVTQSDIDMHDMTVNSSSFHNLHPQFIGYTRGKLHELVMKSYKSREFAAAINEVLDPWINARQPKKELEKHSHNSCLSQDMQKFRRSEDGRAGKRARVLADDSEDDYDLDRDLCSVQKDDCLFEDLCGDVTFVQEKSMQSGSEDSWGLMNGHILARVFHFLRTDTRSLSFSAATCRHWNAAVMFYRDISKQVDLSDAGPNCTDSMFRKIMNCYNKTKITSIILIGCTNISATALEEILLSLPSIYSIDIRGCSQFRELSHKFQNIKWIMSHTPRDTKIVEDSGSKIRSLKQIADKGFSLTKAFKGTNSNLHGDAVSYDYALDSKDSEIRSLGQSFYKTKKLFDARKPTSFLPTDPRMRRWLYRKSENGYRKLEEFLSVSLKDIMKENTFEFFVPKVAEIEDKMKNGYYMGHGLTSVKEDISRMCRDAIKAKNRGGMGDMNRMITLFIHLATSLDESSKSSRERDEMGKMSTASIYKKKHSKTMNEGKFMNRSNGQFYGNGGAENGEYASDREIRRRLAKLNKRPLDSESETSDDLDRSSEEPGADGDSTASDTESDPDLYSEVGIRNYKRDDYLMEDHPFDSMTEDREWGARMTKASLVPPVTRKYEVIDRYVVITDEDDVQRKMRVALPEDYVEKLSAHKNGTEESDVDIPIVKDYKPRKQLGEEVLEQEVYGIDPYTHNLLLDSMPEELDWSLLDKHLFIENELLSTLNTQVRDFTGTGNAPMKYSLQPVVEEIHRTAEKHGDKRILKMCHGILKAMRSRPEDNYVAYRKGLGVVCNREEGFGEDDFVVEFLGEVYPAWKWFEKQDGIRSLQKNTTDPATEFYNIYLERPKGDRDGYDLVVVDAMHKANYASRICHSCRPNCEAKVTAVDGQYQIGVYSVRPIGFGEEITFDYNSVTESKEEYEASVCLCGSQICRGSYLNLTGEGAYQKVISERHGMLHRHQLMLEACQLNFVSEEDYFDLRKAGVGTCLLSGLPDWLVAYAARVVRFINYERTKLPDVILNHNLEEKRKYFADICLEVESNDAQVQAEGVYNQRLQNLALTLDKVRYVMRCVYTDSKKAPPPLEKLNTEEIVSVLWKGEGSLVEELLQCIAPHTEDLLLKELRSKIHDHEPSASDFMGELRKSLIWLRDEIRNLPCTYKCRHDAAADLIHMYAYTKCFFRVHEYKKVTSSPVYISPLDLGPKYMDKLGSGFKEYCKTYGEDYCLGQLIFWHTQNNADPDCNLVKARRGCLLLPDIASFYGKAKTSSKQRVYGPRTVKFMLSRMEKQPQKPWPEERIWTFKSTSRVFGSPMLDAVVNKTSINKEMIHWLKKRPAIFQAMWDR